MADIERVEDLIRVTTQYRGTERFYEFEEYWPFWVLRRFIIDGEYQEIDESMSISSTVREAVKEEAHDPEKGILDNIHAVSADTGKLSLKYLDVDALLEEMDMSREEYKDKVDEIEQKGNR